MEIEYEFEVGGKGPEPSHAFYVPSGKSVMEALAYWHYKCKRKKGRPVYKTSFGGKLPKGTIIVACMFKGSEVPGGKVEGVDPEFWERIDKAPKGQKWKVAEEYYREHKIGPYARGGA